MASYFGGTRNPLVISWPAKIKADKAPRTQFHHVNDIAPTIYEVLGITPPQRGQWPAAGSRSTASACNTASTTPDAKDQKTEQYFENNGSRALYKDGWIASVFGPFIPWQAPRPCNTKWDPDADHGRSMILSKDFSQATDVSASGTDRLAAMKAVSLRWRRTTRRFRSVQATGYASTRRIASRPPIRAGTLMATRSRMPEFTAPGLGRESNIVTIDAEFGEERIRACSMRSAAPPAG